MSIDAAEQKGQFNILTCRSLDALSEAFEKALPLTLFGPDGGLAKSRGGAITWPDRGKVSIYAALPGGDAQPQRRLVRLDRNIADQ